jgi:hypothetical protein
MYRLIERKVYGVLTDFDLASRTVLMDDDYTRTSQQRTGTPPFMAVGLLDGTDPLHLYRHDMESLFYIMLILAAHYEIQARKKGEAGGLRVRNGLQELPYQTWFDQPFYKGLAAYKQTFLLNFEHLNLSPTFEDFRSWLLKLRRSFSSGFCARQQRLREDDTREDDTEEPCDEGTPAPFDNETLAGHVTYSALIRPARHLTGALEGLVVRYDPPSPPPPSSTGAAQANA